MKTLNQFLNAYIALLLLIAAGNAAAVSGSLGSSSDPVNLVSFGNVALGTSKSAAVTATAGAAGTLTVGAAPSGYSISNSTCGAALAAGQSCSFVVTFSPTASQLYTGTILVTSSSTADAPLVLNLTGTGSQAQLSQSTLTLDFGTVDLNAPQIAIQSVKFTNVSTTTSTTAITVNTPPSGFTIQTNECTGAILGPNAACTITVRFNPTEAVTYVGHLQVSSSNTPAAVVALQGKATGAASVTPTVTYSPTSGLDFGSVQVGTVQTKILILKAGSQSVTVSKILIPDGFKGEFTCDSILPANQSCAVLVTFPFQVIEPGVYDASLVVQTNAEGAPHLIPLKGTLAKTAGSSNGTLAFAPATLDFGTLTPGKQKTMTINVTASGANVAVESMSATSTAYTVNSACGTLVPAGGNCSVNITFKPTERVPYNANLLVVSSQGTTTTLALSGSGGETTSSSVPALLSLDTASLTFGTIQAGQSKTLSLGVMNSGGQTGTFTVAGSDAQFQVSAGSCALSGGSMTLSAGSGCSLTVIYAPTASGSHTGSLAFSGQGSSDAKVTLKGIATASDSLAGGSTSTGQLTASSYLVDFGAVNVGSDATQQVSISKKSDLAIASTAASGSFSVSHNCQPGVSTCSLSIKYAPQAVAVEYGTITVTASDGSVVFIAVSGTGLGSLNNLGVRMSGEVRGSASSLTLAGDFAVADASAAPNGNYYVAAVYQGQVWFISPAGVQLLTSGSEPSPYLSSGYGPTRITVFNGVDLSYAPGAEIYLGYGQNLQEMLVQGQYQRVYVVR